jgi:hypothetical protein
MSVPWHEQLTFLTNFKDYEIPKLEGGQLEGVTFNLKG